MNTATLFSSKSCEWETPAEVFEELDSEFHFDLDVAANAANPKVENFNDIKNAWFAKEWVGIIWMNPPYGRDILKWIQKAYEAARRGATVVCLIPSRTDTRWWHEYCMKGEIRFIKGRLKFGGHKNAAPFPSAVVIFRPPTKIMELCAHSQLTEGAE